MTVATETGYSWTDGKYARILHAKNRLAVKGISASDEVTNYPASAVDSGDTVDRWRPFETLLTDGNLFDSSGWSITGATAGADFQTITQDTSTGAHFISQTYTFPNTNEHILAFVVERQTAPEIRVLANDGTTSYTVVFDLRDISISGSSNASGEIESLGNERYLLRIYFTPAAGTGYARLIFTDGATNNTFTGDGVSSVRVLKAILHESEATLDLDLYTAEGATCFGVAAHNLASSIASITFSHDSDDNGVYTDIGSVTPTDDSPILFFFSSISSAKWRIKIARGALPEIGVIWLGNPLKMERPFYSGFTPARLDRQTEVLGNLSGSGQLLGRSKQRTTLQTSCSWNNLTYSWVRSNIDGPDGLVQAVEDEPLFLAWRPELTEDVDYLMQASVSQVPQTTGTRDLMTMGLSGTSLSYE